MPPSRRSVACRGAGPPSGPDGMDRSPGGPAPRHATDRRDGGMTTLDYLRDGAAIYEQSFATIRAETDLSRVPADLEKVAVRMIHACGMVDLVEDLDSSPGVGARARTALLAGAPILCDAQMVARGITRSRLPADNPVVCTLNDPGVAEVARTAATTRSAAAVDRWLDRLDGSVVAVGNAPTALFRLLEQLEESEEGRGGVAHRDDRSVESVEPAVYRGGRSCRGRGARHLGHAGVVQGAHHRVVRGKARAGDAAGDHLGVAEDRRAGEQRRAGARTDAGRAVEVLDEVDHPARVDHAHRDLLEVGRHPRQVGFGADRGERLLIDRGAVAQVVERGHATVPTVGRVSRGRSAGTPVHPVWARRRTATSASAADSSARMTERHGVSRISVAPPAAAASASASKWSAETAVSRQRRPTHRRSGPRPGWTPRGAPADVGCGGMARRASTGWMGAVRAISLRARRRPSARTTSVMRPAGISSGGAAHRRAAAVTARATASGVEASAKSTSAASSGSPSATAKTISSGSASRTAPSERSRAIARRVGVPPPSMSTPNLCASADGSASASRARTAAP